MNTETTLPWGKGYLIGGGLFCTLLLGLLWGYGIGSGRKPAPPRVSKTVTISYQGTVVGIGKITERGDYVLDSKKLGWEVEVQTAP